MKEITVKVAGHEPRTYSSNTSVSSILHDIDPSLTDNAVAAKVNGQMWDWNRSVESDAELAPVSADSREGHALLLHSAAHLMAQAVKEYFPEAQMTIGPAIENRFYYDFDVETTFSEDDLSKIENRMRELSSEDFVVKREVVDCESARKFFKKQNESYKVEMIDDFEDEEVITTYTQGDFVDLCRGPHLPTTGMIKYFQLLNTAGAYWRGDENNKMLQRIYGTAFYNEDDLNAYLEQIKAAKERNHRKLGKELDLFFFDQLSPGSPFFLPKGAIVYNELQNFIRELYRKYDYREVVTPQVYDVELWKQSGHWELFREYLYHMKIGEREFGLKPMNCPGHAILFGSDLHSYRDLPVRIADFGRLHRYEKAGVISGLTRVRSFSQDDAHIFCTMEQVTGEITSLIGMVNVVFETFGFESVKVELSKRPNKALGDANLWQETETILSKSLKENGVDYVEMEGEGAFYGPKIDFHAKDALGRYHQLSTIQLDFTLPERFKLEYVAEDGSHQQPVMIHRAILGSIERFLGVYLEHCGGDFPLWLAPTQVAILPVSEKFSPYGFEVLEKLQSAGLRVEIDERADKVGAKIRNAETQKTNVMLIVGGREMESKEVSVRRRFVGDQGQMKLEALISELRSEINERRRHKSSQK
ncbi:MAG: threonine--tRNA ligase [Candidatus Marinimicrobia bacterium]|nr:threonine--tRNA ligase [Candidatus Neomarinimicrobiota bacterium]|tara:strand:- start:3584 stop:5518 length:1935 start_codon:yes stop_codon:yes gene_type:complete